MFSVSIFPMAQAMYRKHGLGCRSELCVGRVVAVSSVLRSAMAIALCASRRVTAVRFLSARGELILIHNIAVIIGQSRLQVLDLIGVGMRVHMIVVSVVQDF